MTFVWVTRIRNAAGDDAMSTANRNGAFALSAVCLVGAAVVATLGARSSRPRWVVAIVVAHGLVWLVRGAQIAAGDRPPGFKVVHVALAAVSIALAAAIVRSTRPTRAGDMSHSVGVAS